MTTTAPRKRFAVKPIPIRNSPLTPIVHIEIHSFCPPILSLVVPQNALPQISNLTCHPPSQNLSHFHPNDKTNLLHITSKRDRRFLKNLLPRLEHTERVMCVSQQVATEISHLQTDAKPGFFQLK